MSSATLKAFALSGLLMAAAAGVSAGTPAHASEQDPAATAHPPAEQRQDDAATGQMLSTLGAIALGVVGLWWIRRHTAQL